jgi:hypothetical protein
MRCTDMKKDWAKSGTRCLGLKKQTMKLFSGKILFYGFFNLYLIVKLLGIDGS